MFMRSQMVRIVLSCLFACCCWGFACLFAFVYFVFERSICSVGFVIAAVVVVVVVVVVFFLFQTMVPGPPTQTLFHYSQ